MAHAPDKLLFVDALRGYAILLIILVHSASGAGLPEPFLTLCDFGARGVQLFYVVSAFTLCLSWRSRGDGAQAFYLRRLFRIAPMWWLAMGVFLAVWGTGPGYWAPEGVGAREIGLSALMLHSLDPRAINSVVPGGWSVAVEVAFYLAFPALIFAIRNVWVAALSAIAAGVVAVLLHKPIIYFWMPILGEEQLHLALNYGLLWPIAQLPIFVVGFVVFFAATRWKLAPTLIGEAALVLLIAGTVATRFLTTEFSYLLAGVGFGGIAYLMSQGHGRWAISGAVQAIGKVSYSAYLWHFLALWLIGLTVPSAALDWLGPFRVVATFVMATGLTLAMATVTYHFVEKPFVRWGSMAMQAWRPARA